jgi:hypothetical protein
MNSLLQIETLEPHLDLLVLRDSEAARDVAFRPCPASLENFPKLVLTKRDARESVQ